MPFTGNAIFYPDGAQAQRIGVRIDRPYYPSREEILTGEDILLNKASSTHKRTIIPPTPSHKKSDPPFSESLFLL